MGLFQKRQDYIPPQAFAIGGTSRVELTREFAIESIILRIRFTVSAASTTMGSTGDGLLGILKKLTLSVSDGSRTRNVVDASAGGLIEYARQINGFIDRHTSAALNANTVAAPQVIPVGEYMISVPVYFSHPGVDDPVGSIMLLPAPRFSSNPVLQLQWAGSAAEMGTTLAVTPDWFDIQVNRRQVSIPNWTYYDTELVENQVAFPAAGNNQLYELPTPGSFTGILLRGYVGSSPVLKGDPTTGLTTALTSQIPGTAITSNEVKLQLLGTVLRRFKTSQCELENDLTCGLGSNSVNNGQAVPNTFTPAPSYVMGNYYMDFLTDKSGTTTGDFGSTLDSNVLLATGNRVQLLTDVQSVNSAWKVLTHRIYGDLSPFKLGSKPVTPTK